MQWCLRHWDKLRAEVKRQGLDALVPDSGEKAAAAFADAIDRGTTTLDNFDPLMGAMWSVNEYLGRPMGPHGLIAVIQLEGCPVCKVDEVHMAGCQDPRHDKPCTTSIDWCFVNAVRDMRTEWESMRP